MDVIYLGLATACGLAIWGLALFCHHLHESDACLPRPNLWF